MVEAAATIGGITHYGVLLVTMNGICKVVGVLLARLWLAWAADLTRSSSHKSRLISRCT
jgi:hypothetical protein